MDNKPYSFMTDDAIRWKSADLAAMIYNLRFWLDKNKANHRPGMEETVGISHVHDGRVWTYNTLDAWSKLFPWLSASQIQRMLKKLEEGGLLIKGNYNKSPFDKTVWYTLDEPAYRMVENDQNHATTPENTDIAKSQSRQFESATSTVQNRNIFTDKKPYKNLGSNKPAEAVSADFDFDLVLMFILNTCREAGYNVDDVIEKAYIVESLKEYQAGSTVPTKSRALSHVQVALQQRHGVIKRSMKAGFARDERNDAVVNNLKADADKINRQAQEKKPRDINDTSWINKPCAADVIFE